jgi:hypothetical protein
MKTSGVMTALLLGAGLVLGGGWVASASAQASDPISEAAAVYMTYQSDAEAVGAKPFRSAGDIEAALGLMGSYNADQLSRGWMAYSAMIAAQDPLFASKVRDIYAFYGAGALRSFARGDGYARSLEGGNDAVGAAVSVTRSDLSKIYTSAAMVKEQGYSLQGYGWAKARIHNGNERSRTVQALQLKGRSADNMIVSALMRASPLSSDVTAGVMTVAATAEDVTGAVRLPAFLTSGFTGSRETVKFGKESVADQIASLAALRIIGTDAVDQARLSSVMTERTSQSCLRMENLELQGCVASVGQQFEVPHCISSHAMAEVADCLGSIYK